MDYDSARADEANKRFVFPAFVLKPGEHVTIYTGSGENTGAFLYWSSREAIWNNSGDTLYLRNVEEELILYSEY